MDAKPYRREECEKDKAFDRPRVALFVEDEYYRQDIVCDKPEDKAYPRAEAVCQDRRFLRRAVEHVDKRRVFRRFENIFRDPHRYEVDHRGKPADQYKTHYLAEKRLLIDK